MKKEKSNANETAKAVLAWLNFFGEPSAERRSREKTDRVAEMLARFDFSGINAVVIINFGIIADGDYFFSDICSDENYGESKPDLVSWGAKKWGSWMRAGMDSHDYRWMIYLRKCDIHEVRIILYPEVKEFGFTTCNAVWSAAEKRWVKAWAHGGDPLRDSADVSISLRELSVRSAEDIVRYLSN